MQSSIRQITENSSTMFDENNAFLFSACTDDNLFDRT